MTAEGRSAVEGPPPSQQPGPDGARNQSNNSESLYRGDGHGRGLFPQRVGADALDVLVPELLGKEDRAVGLRFSDSGILRRGANRPIEPEFLYRPFHLSTS